MNTKKSNYYFKYTLLFIICCFFVFFEYIKNGKTLIYDGDGWSQHYKAYLFYSEYLKNIVKALINNHKIIIPQWSFSLGEGAGIIETFHYYTFGDPFAFLTLFIPTKYIYLYYNFSILLRLYLAGLFFSFLCFYKKLDNQYAVLSGSLIYVFCFWGIFTAARHIYFLNPLVYMPLIILGIEKILDNKSPYLFVIAVLVSCLSNFYFFYNIVFLTVIYVVVRLLVLYRNNIKEIINKLLIIIKYSIIAVLIGAIILLPMLYVFINDSRMSIQFDYHLIYPLSYYLKLPSTFISTTRKYWLCMGFACPVIFALINNIIDIKKSITLFVLTIIAVIMVLFPIFGQIMNGMSYISNKWCFGLSLLVAYSYVFQYNSLKEKKRIFAVTFLLFSLICVIFGSGINVNVPLIIGFIYLLLLFVNEYKTENNGLCQIMMLLLIIANITFLANWQFASYGSNYASTGTDIDDDKTIFEQSEAYEIFNQIDDNTFYRYSGSDLTQNASILFGTHSTDYYWSLTNQNISKYRTDLNLSEYSLFNYKEYDQRMVLYTLAGVKYYITPGDYNGLIPNNFVYEKTINSNKIYRNESFLPLGYTYENSISYDEWISLNVAEKDEILTKAIILNGGNNNTYTTKCCNYEYTINPNENIVIENNKIIVKKESNTLNISFDKDDDNSLYFEIKGLKFDDNKKWISDKKTAVKIDITSSNNITKTIECRTNDDKYFNGRENFAVYLGDDNIENISLTFYDEGIYSYDSISLVSLDNKECLNNISLLAEDVLESIEVDTNIIKGTVDLNKDKYLLLTIPYSKGFKAYVDNEEAELLNANIAYMGLKLNKGHHTIELRYQTPYLKEGFLVSIVGIVLLIVDIIWKKKNE